MRKLLNVLIPILLFLLSGCYSCKSWNDFWGTGRVDPDCAGKFFFDKDCRPIVKAYPAPPPPKPKPAPVNECGPFTVSRSYPCEGCGVIRVDKSMPREVQLNAPFDYTIKVTNLTNMMVADVVLTENLPNNFKFTKASPEAKKEGNKLVWTMDALESKESGLITVWGTPTKPDCLKYCATVTYVVPACSNVKVVEPELKLVKTAPSEVLLCDPIPVKFVVTNPGTGSAQDVKIEDALPSGLQTAEGMSNLVFNAGTLTSGQSRQFSATLKASKTGKYVNKAVASSAEGLKAESETTTTVRQPVLAISKTGPEQLYLGRSATYEITVTNNGNAAAKNLVVEDSVPPGTQFVSASNGGRIVQSKVVWNLGTLETGRSRKVSLTLSPQTAGDVTNTAMAKATCAEGVRASTKTIVAGISALLMEVIDLADPVEVGSNETYVITITNQGSAAATNITIKCVLAEPMKYRSSSGDTVGSFSADTVTFRPLASLAPKAKATWRVVVEAAAEGDHRFKVIMNSDQLTRTVEETESTHFYK